MTKPLRRTVLSLPGLLPFLSPVLARAQAAAESSAPLVAGGLNGGLAAFAAAEDVVALVGGSSAFDPDVSKTLLEHREHAHAYAGLWLDRSEPLAVISAAANGGAKPRPQELGAALMWLVHRGVEQGLEGEAGATSDRSVYQDVGLMRWWAGAGAQTQVEADALLVGLQTIERRLFIRIHTIEPDSDDPAGWIERLVDWHEGRAQLLARYTSVITNPDAALWRQHVEGKPPLFAVKDRVLSVLQRARQGDRLPAKVVLEAMNGEAGCAYGQAVLRACRALQSAGRHLGGKAREAQFRNELKQLALA